MLRYIPRCLPCFAVAALIGLSPFQADAREDGAPARALGMGDAVRALGFGTAGLYVNPACMSQGLQNAIDVGYGYRSWEGRHNGHASFVDSKTNPSVAGGAGYSYVRGKWDDALTQFHDLRFGVSSGYRSTSFSFYGGLGFRYINIKRKDYKSSRNDLDVWKPTMDLGILFGISDLIFIGVTAQNLIKMPVTPTGSSTKKGAPYAPRKVGIGVGLVYSILHFGVDVDIDLQSKSSATASPMAGLELTLAQSVAIRAGFQWDRVGDLKTDQKRITAGLGYISQYVGVDVGYGHDVSHSKNWVIESSIRVFLP
jgi:opacity protein-like surface antigen